LRRRHGSRDAADLHVRSRRRHADQIEQAPPGMMDHVLRRILNAKPADEIDHRSCHATLFSRRTATERQQRDVRSH